MEAQQRGFDRHPGAEVEKLGTILVEALRGAALGGLSTQPRRSVPPFARRIPRVNQPHLGCGVYSARSRIAGRPMPRHRLPLIAIALLAAFAGISPVTAQFGTIFGGPPRPPADIPGRRGGPPVDDDRYYGARQQQPPSVWPREPQVVPPPPGGYPPPPPGYPQQGYPPQQAGRPPGVQQQDLPPPPGATAAPPGPAGLPPGQRPPRGTPGRDAGSTPRRRTTRW